MTFIVSSGEYDNYIVWAQFTTREKADAYAAACNAQSVVEAGVPGLSALTKEEAAHCYRVEEGEYNVDVDPDPPSVVSVDERFVQSYGSRARYDEWMAGGRYYRDQA